MEYVWATLFIAVLGMAMTLHIFTLPANWVALGLLALWKWTHPGVFTWQFFIILTCVALAAELLEFGLQAWSAKRFGASSRGNIGGIVGAIVGAIFGAPFLFGIGALLGALAGAFAGCLIVEWPGRDRSEAIQAAWGAFWGKAFGFTAKISAGAAMIALAIPKIWP